MKVASAVIGSPGNAIRTLVIQWVVLRERHEDETIATLVDQVETVVKELPEESHEGVERCREAFVWCSVGNQELGDARDVRFECRATFICRGPDRCRVRGRLIDDQVAEQARGGVLHGPPITSHVGGVGPDSVIGGEGLRQGLGSIEHWSYEIEKFQGGSAEARVSRKQVITAAVHRPQAPGNARVRQEGE